MERWAKTEARGGGNGHYGGGCGAGKFYATTKIRFCKVSFPKRKFKIEVSRKERKKKRTMNVAAET